MDKILQGNRFLWFIYSLITIFEGIVNLFCVIFGYSLNWQYKFAMFIAKQSSKKYKKPDAIKEGEQRGQKE